METDADQVMPPPPEVVADKGHQPTIGRKFNPFHGPQLADPYPVYAQARKEAPVFYSELLQLWYVTRYDDIVTVARNPARFSSAEAVNVPLDYTEATRQAIASSFLSHGSLTNNDPPSHTKIRRLVNKAFTTRQVADLEDRVRAIANDLIDRFAGDGQAELVRQFSFPLPMRVILNVLGAPEDDLLTLKQWADDWIALLSVQLTPAQQAETVGRLLQSQEYWTRLIDQRRAHPRDDLLSALIQASWADPDPIGLLQLVNVCSSLALAGHETTTNLLGNCLYRLLRMPDQWQLVQRERANIPRAVEETLRCDTSVHALMRTTTEPVELGGVRLPQGARLALLFASANHDEAYFPDAARFDLRRLDPKGHLAFGHGIHHCVGAPLARLELRVALELLIDRLPGLRLAGGQQVTFAVNPVHRGVRELHLEWDV
ncbi:MAG TPA: cytochrome P450 [Actinomycetes bacterium]|nr:cytochrome P450 [Actinomycetes bacterium]